MQCACGCGRTLTGRQRKYATSACRPNPFAANHAPYGTYAGPAGNPADWREAFQQRFTQAEIAEHLGERSAWDVLGIRAGATVDEIKRAYRKRAKETHPDLHPNIDRVEFQRVQAAYQKLTAKVNY